MTPIELLFRTRAVLVEAPSYVFHWLFSWVYPTTLLRAKAAVCPYPRTRVLMLRRSGIRVGRNARIGLGNVVVGRGRHPPAVTFGERATTGPLVSFVTSSYPDDSRLCDHPEAQRMMTRLSPIHVEEDAWIGAGAILFPGITIGRGAIVGAGAVVREDVPPYTVVAGVPARVIRKLAEPPSASPGQQKGSTPL